MQSILSATIFGDREDPRVRLQALFGGDLPKAGQPPIAALHWGRNVVGDTTDLVIATRMLRKAEPQLTLKAAVFLAKHATRG